MQYFAFLFALALVLLQGCATGPQGSRESTTAKVPGMAEVATSQPLEAWAADAQLFDGLGTLHREVTTSSPGAQAYFDQGLRLSFAFNHDEATRSFARAAELDPSCASCFWGIALTLGPNYNIPMLSDRAPAAWNALVKATRLAPRASPVEQMLIAALNARYPGPNPLPPRAMQTFNERFAAAMRKVAKAFPEDDDVQVLFAEALMDVAPWKLWSLDGKANPGTHEIVTTLETVLRRNPRHPGANHYYIHAVEASRRPDQALPSAERLPALAPAAGHLVHMPAHIYQRIGRYADAAQSNRLAVEVDQRYLARTRPPGYYPVYVSHNYGFLAFSAAMAGRSAEALRAARESARAMPPEMLSRMPGMDFFAAEPYLVMVRFAKWTDLVTEPRPDARYPLLTALWLHAHGMALAKMDRLAEAEVDRRELGQLLASLPADMSAGLNSAKDIVGLSAKVLEAQLASARNQRDAGALWSEAIEREDRLAYAEPADWFYPVRHLFGAYLLASEQPREAEQIYREDLRRNPDNGWSLYGLMKALEAQNKNTASVYKAYRRSWRYADLPDASIK